METTTNTDKIRQAFVANVSHELRTPLTVIHGYMETLIELYADGDPELVNILKAMRQQSTRMKNIVEDLLLLSRLESQQLDPEKTSTVFVPQLLTMIIEDAKSLGQHQHAFVTDIDKHLSLRGADNELHSAFSNLIFNAVRYTPEGGTITIHWYQDEQAKHLVIQDTGPGIEAKHIPRLTERFYRVDKGRSRESGGTGLGLAIVKHVVLRHHGKLDIHSEVGKGSTFHCCFPVISAKWLSNRELPLS